MHACTKTHRVGKDFLYSFSISGILSLLRARGEFSYILALLDLIVIQYSLHTTGDTKMKRDEMIKLRTAKLVEMFVDDGHFPIGTVTSTVAAEAFNAWLTRKGLFMRAIGAHSMALYMRRNPNLETWRDPPKNLKARLLKQPVVI